MLVVLTAGVAGYSLTQHERKVHLAELEGKASRIAELLSAALDQPLWNVDKASIDVLLRTIASNQEVVEFTVYDARFGVVSSVRPQHDMGPSDAVVRVRDIFHAASGDAPREKLGQIRVVLSKSLVEREMRHEQLAVLATMALLLAMLYVAIHLVLRSAVHTPINRLRAAIDAIASGDLNVECPITSTDEFGQLAIRMNSMVHRLRNSTELLRESEAKYRRIFENAIEGIFLLHRDGCLCEANPAMARVLRYQSTEYLINGSAAAHESLVFSPAQVRALFAASEIEDRIVGVELQIRRRDGAAIWVEVNARSIPDGNGAPEYIEGLLTDITERRRAREKLQQHRDRLQCEVAERRRAEADLLASREQLRRLSAHMEEIRESDRKQISMTVHDELGQLLTALKIDVSLLKAKLPEDGPEWQKAKQMLALIERTMRIVRDVASHLRPVALNYGLAAALEWLASEHMQHGEVPCRFHIDGDEPDLPEAQSTAIFRIAQEALTNIARHARATCVEIRLASTASSIELTVTDNGTGFDLSTACGKGSLLQRARRSRFRWLAGVIAGLRRVG
ncbi:PAS domain S-box protein [Burkholderia reimsis]|uniref:sensor histidine kinase n=1 Tax=Burkholderia reimsis TaxID=2234132 RepID=UPI001FCBDF76|nr:PAS domain S-box protein [Burkholderia reimsis]